MDPGKVTFLILMAAVVIGTVLVLLGFRLGKPESQEERNRRHEEFLRRGQEIAAAHEASRKYCIRCGSVGQSTHYRRGSVALGVFLCLFLLVPGVIYLIWMSFASYEGCDECGAKEIVPLDSPVARRAVGTSSPAAG